jgi:SAM-dependent methyltransferase
MLSNLRLAIRRRSRAKKMEQFYALCPEGSQILDVGVSGMMGPDDPERNSFLREFTRAPSTYTGLGVEDLTALRCAFPQFRLVQYPGGAMPFADNEFDWAFSNAVIEHVGGSGEQLAFIDEMLRVSRAVYFTTPNRWFPVETHSSVLFLHWNRRAFDRWAAAKGYSWLTAKELRLLGYRELSTLLEASLARAFRIRRNWIPGVPWPMTFSVIASRDPSRIPATWQGD